MSFESVRFLKEHPQSWLMAISEGTVLSRPLHIAMGTLVVLADAAHQS